jgi:hypothetical protein
MQLSTKLLMGLAVIAASGTAQAAITSIANPGGTTTEIGTRIRWGANGFEASIFDNIPFGQTPTLNPSGTPVWALNQAYKFKVDFDTVTGTLSLAVDFNLNDSFAANESISRSVFGGTNPDYIGEGFRYLSISGNEGGSTARSKVQNLKINGSALPSLEPGGAFIEQFYKDSSGNLIPTVTITGELTFLTSGTSQERPSWNFNFKNAAVVPEPSTYVAGALAVLPLLVGGVRKWRQNRANKA